MYTYLDVYLHNVSYMTSLGWGTGIGSDVSMLGAASVHACNTGPSGCRLCVRACVRCLEESVACHEWHAACGAARQYIRNVVNSGTIIKAHPRLYIISDALSTTYFRLTYVNLQNRWLFDSRIRFQHRASSTISYMPTSGRTKNFFGFFLRLPSNRTQFSSSTTLEYVHSWNSDNVTRVLA